MLARRSWHVATLAICMAFTLPAAASIAKDTDGDGLDDGFETSWGVTSPTRVDTDRDGIVDAAEDEDEDKLGNLGEQRFGTDPGDPDSDADGVLDGDDDSDDDGIADARTQDQRPLPTSLRPLLDEAEDDRNGVGVWCSVADGRSALRQCHFGDVESETTIVLMGDSKAHALLLPFKRAALREGWHVVTLIKGACVPLLGTLNVKQHLLDAGHSCTRWKRGALKLLNEREDPADLVVITHSNRYRIAGPDGAVAPKEDWPRLWRDGVRRTVAALPKGTSALILGDVPTNYGNPVACLLEDATDISACASPRQDPEQRPVESALRDGAAASGAAFGSLYDAICTYDPCPLVHGDVMLWRDRSHLTATFSGHLTNPVRTLLAEALP